MSHIFGFSALHYRFPSLLQWYHAISNMLSNKHSLLPCMFITCLLWLLLNTIERIEKKIDKNKIPN